MPRRRAGTDAIRDLGPRARGVAAVPPDVTDAELARLHAAGFRGARCYMPSNAADRTRVLVDNPARLYGF